jgi:membrane-associated phospholipid phosphatase
MRTRRLNAGRVLVPLLFLVAFGLAVLLDPWAYRVLLAPGTRHADWAQVLRQLGYLPTWLLIALLIYLHDASRPGESARGIGPVLLKRAGPVFLAAALSGVIANILKPVIGRLRPDELGITRFAPRPNFLWAEAGEIGFGLPSGHAAVAFGGCAILGLLWPAWRTPMRLLAAGCALTRLLAGAHALSDTVLAAGIGLAVAAWLAPGATPGARSGRAPTRTLRLG